MYHNQVLDAVYQQIRSDLIAIRKVLSMQGSFIERRRELKFVIVNLDSVFV